MQVLAMRARSCASACVARLVSIESDNFRFLHHPHRGPHNGQDKQRRKPKNHQVCQKRTTTSHRMKVAIAMSLKIQPLPPASLLPPQCRRRISSKGSVGLDFVVMFSG